MKTERRFTFRLISCSE